MDFELTKYLGVWYELAHRRNWFESEDGRNTRAEYRLLVDSPDRKVISVANTTEVHGDYHTSHGTATWLGGVSFHVTFPEMERVALSKKPGFGQPVPEIEDPSYPNYVIDRIWYNSQGYYSMAVVTDQDRQGLYLLSRTPDPTSKQLNIIKTYVADTFGLEGLVWTAHGPWISPVQTKR